MKPAPRITFTQAMDHPEIFGKWFSPRESWATWRVVGKALFAEPMMPEEVEVFQRHTGRTVPPTEPASEFWAAVGRRGGKGWFAAAVALYLACLRKHQLKRGELGRVMVMAADKDQAGEVFRYISELIDSTPILAPMVVSRNKESIELDNGIAIEVRAASFRRVRGRKVLAAICDEIALWYSDETSANPDSEILTALRPSMLGVPGALLLCISSPYARKGTLWTAYKEHFGKDSDVLVWQASTLAMNPGADRKFLEREEAKDPVSFRAEYGAHFREDLETFISPEAVDAVTVKGRTFLPYEPGHRYHAFADPAGGSGGDSFTLAIARRDGDKAVLCRVAEWKPPFDPDQAAAEACEILREYKLRTVEGDHYAGDWPASRFRANGAAYLKADKSKSDIYAAFLPLVNGQRVELLDHAKMLAQLLGLERSTSRLGRDTITHAANPSAHDDIINSAAGAVVGCFRARALEGYKAPVSEEKKIPKAGKEALVGNDLGRVEWHACPHGHRSAVSTRSEKEALERGQGCLACNPGRGWRMSPFGIIPGRLG